MLGIWEIHDFCAQKGIKFFHLGRDSWLMQKQAPVKELHTMLSGRTYAKLKINIKSL